MSKFKTFSIEDFRKGKEVYTMSGRLVKFITILKDPGIPAPLIVGVFRTLPISNHDDGYTWENYYLNGKHMPPTESYLDLQTLDW